MRKRNGSLQRAIALCEEPAGEEHSVLASALNNLGLLYQEQGRYEEAESLLLRALSLRVRRLGEGHLSTQVARENYTILLDKKSQAEGAKKLEEKR